MPKVVVYVPAAAWKRLEQRGLDPAVTVREFAKRGYEMTDEPPVTERTQVTMQPERVSIARIGGCPMNPPRGTKCKSCGKVHA